MVLLELLVRGNLSKKIHSDLFLNQGLTKFTLFNRMFLSAIRHSLFHKPIRSKNVTNISLIGQYKLIKPKKRWTGMEPRGFLLRQSLYMWGGGVICLSLIKIGLMVTPLIGMHVTEFSVK